MCSPFHNIFIVTAMRPSMTTLLAENSTAVLLENVVLVDLMWQFSQSVVCSCFCITVGCRYRCNDILCIHLEQKFSCNTFEYNTLNRKPQRMKNLKLVMENIEANVFLPAACYRVWFDGHRITDDFTWLGLQHNVITCIIMSSSIRIVVSMSI